MQIEYELNQTDFTEAFVAHRSKGSFAQWVRVILFWFIILVTSVVLYSAVRTHNISSALPFFLIAFIWIVVIQGILPRWNMRRQYTNQPGAHGPRMVTLDATGAHWRWNGGSGDVEWKNYIRSVEGPNHILFYTSPACFNIVPKRGLSAEQLANLRELLKQNIPSGK